MAIDSVNSAAPIITGATIGAAVGGAATWKGAPILASKFAENMDVYVGQAKDKAFDKLVDAGITKKNKIAKALEKVGQKASQDFKNSHKILNKVVEFTKTHKKSTIAIGAAALAVVGGIIGKVIADKKAE